MHIEVYINLFYIDSDHLTKENVGVEIYDAVYKLQQAEAFAVVLGDLPS